MTEKENILQPTTLQEAVNYIKFLTTSHKQEISKMKEAHQKQQEVIRKMQMNRKRELEFLSKELRTYEYNLAVRTENVAKQLSEKDELIKKQAEIIEELRSKIKSQDNFVVPEINILVDSNSDSGVALDNEEINKIELKPEVKGTRKCSRRIADSISFLRRVDFSPMKYKPSTNRETKKKEDKKTLDVPIVNKRLLMRHLSNERPSDDDRALFDDAAVFSDGPVEEIMIRPKQMNDSMNNHFSDDGSEDTSEEQFDRVMTRSSIRRSVKANPKYKKINRTKSKLLEHIKVNIVD